MDAEIVVRERERSVITNAVHEKGKSESVEVCMEGSLLNVDNRFIRPIQGLIRPPLVIVSGRRQGSYAFPFAVQHGINSILTVDIVVQVADLFELKCAQLHEYVCKLVENVLKYSVR
jgi:hypothetical protein